MTDTTMLWEAVRLMLVGMGIVYAFLLLLVGMLNLMTVAVRRLAPAAPGEAVELAPAAAPIADPELLAVLTTAVARYRAGRGR